MNRNPRTILIPLLGLALAAGAATPALAAEENPWRLELAVAYSKSTTAGAPQGSYGPGLSLEYRATPRLGVELGGLTGDFDDEVTIEFFGAVLTAESELRMTPILGRLDFYLTPGRRAELYVGPVAGWVRMSDATIRLRASFPGVPEEVQEIRLDTEDQFTWGAHLGVDVRLGSGRSYLTAGATYLDLPLEVKLPEISTPEEDIEFARTDLDPLILHFGYGIRF